MKMRTEIVIKIDDDLKEKVSSIASKEGYELSDIVLAYLSSFEGNGDIPLFLYPYLPIKNQEQIINIQKIQKVLKDIIDLYGKGLVKRAYLFGSYARGEETPTSDIDIRLEAIEGLSLFDLGGIRQELVDVLHREIDLLCIDKDKMDPAFYESLKKDEICIYERK